MSQPDAGEEATAYVEWVYANPGQPPEEYAVILSHRLAAFHNAAVAAEREEICKFIKSMWLAEENADFDEFLARVFRANEMSQWQPIETVVKGVPVLLGYQAEGRVHLESKYGVGIYTNSFGLCDWPWTLKPTHWQPIEPLPAIRARGSK